MATGLTEKQAELTEKELVDWGRVPYRFTAEQVLKMGEAGLFGNEDVELWDGVLYKMTKGELHNAIKTQVGNSLRAVTPAGFHVREETSARDGDDSLPEPDVAVVRGGLWDYLPLPPPLSRLALVVEVSHHTWKADSVDKFARYAEVGIPIYWLVHAPGRAVFVYGDPRGEGKNAHYVAQRRYEIGEEFPIVIDGREAGRVVVADLFPPEAHG